jgi:hypothetical protein
MPFLPTGRVLIQCRTLPESGRIPCRRQKGQKQKQKNRQRDPKDLFVCVRAWH